MTDITTQDTFSNTPSKAPSKDLKRDKNAMLQSISENLHMTQSLHEELSNKLHSQTEKLDKMFHAMASTVDKNYMSEESKLRHFGAAFKAQELYCKSVYVLNLMDKKAKKRAIDVEQTEGFE